MLASAATVIAFQLLDHESFSVHVATEILAFGIAFPACTWFLLTALARHMARQAALSTDLEQYRQISRQLGYYQDREELAYFVTRFPGTLMPFDQVSLDQYDHLRAQMEFVDEWNADGRAVAPAAYAPKAANAQYVWQIGQSAELHHSCDCPLITRLPGESGVQRLCLPLVCDKMLVGLLRLRCLPGKSLSDRQMRFLNAIASHLALALALSIAYPRQVTEAQRAERRRMAYELHDSLAQQIGFLHLSLDRLAGDERLAHADGLQREVEQLREVANDSYLQVRDNLNLLWKPNTTELVQMIDSYVHSIKSQVPFEIQFTVTGASHPLVPTTSQRIFGLIQESLNNAQKHAQAHIVQIALAWHANQLDVTVTDDGVGFEAAALPETGRYGLTMMRERIQDLRGEMRVTSASGAGTTVQFEIPLR